jgi:hypothetical protein
VSHSDLIALMKKEASSEAARPTIVGEDDLDDILGGDSGSAVSGLAVSAHRGEG